MAVEPAADAGQWSDEQAIQALSDAGRSEFGGEEQATQPAPTAPEGETQQTAEPEGQPEAQVAPEPTEPNLFEGTQVNPDELIREHPELAPLVKQLQGAFTQKTQDLAAQRAEIEALGDPESLQQAVELFDRISDPQNWGQLHSELTAAMQEMGMTPAEASAAATEALSETPAPAAPDFSDIDDPAIEPLARQLQEMQARLDSVEKARQEELANQEAERQYIQAITEMQRQEAAIREAHPEWDDSKIEAAYQMSSYFNGNLAQGAARLEQLLASERELYLAQKAGSLNDSTRTPAATFAPDATKVVEPTTLREAEAEAEEYFKALLANEGV